MKKADSEEEWAKWARWARYEGVRRRIRKRTGGNGRDMGVGSNSLGGRRQALLGLTQHRHDFKKHRQTWGEHIIWGSWGLLNFFGFTVELMNF